MDGGLAGSRPSALLLDLDGTLVDSEPTHRAAYRSFFVSRGWPTDEGTMRLFTGRRADDVFAAEDGPWRDEDPLDLLRAVLAEYDSPDLLSPMPVRGAGELLDWARRRGVALGLVTSANLAWARVALAPLGGVEMFDVVVTRDDVEHGKPHPQGYATACRLLGVDPGRSVACEDAPAGVFAARAALVGHVAGITTTWQAAELVSAGTHSTHADLAGVVALLRGDRSPASG